jgi:hypothetical protein
MSDNILGPTESPGPLNLLQQYKQFILTYVPKIYVALN